MLRVSVLTSCVCLPLLACAGVSPEPKTSVASADPTPVFVTQASALDVRLDGELYRGVLALPLEDERNVVNLGAGREPIPVCVVEGERETCVTVRPDEPLDVIIRHGGEDRVLELSYLGPQVSFSSEYQAMHRGTLDIEIPVAYELVNVAIALTPYARENPGLAAPSPYLDEVRTTFAAQADHPFVTRLDQLMREDGSNYHTLKMNGAAFVLGDDNTVARHPMYKSTGWGGNDLLPLMEEMQDFARATGFAQFYEAHLPLYNSQVDYLRRDVGVDGMIAWLGTEFPDVTPYDHTYIVFSPLVGYNQSVKTFDEDGFRQLMPHVNFPYPEEDDAELSAEALKLYRGLILFTELNHGYINPTIDAYSGAIQDAMPDVSVWAANETAQGYGSGTGIFTEMTNWALISVRAYDVLPEAEADKIAARVERIMVRSRGFTRFGAFQRRFLELTRVRDEGVAVASVFPALVASLPDIAS